MPIASQNLSPNPGLLQLRTPPFQAPLALSHAFVPSPPFSLHRRVGFRHDTTVGLRTDNRGSFQEGWDKDLLISP